MKVYVTAYSPESNAWTLSLYPDRLGWETDCGWSSYGLPKELAEQYAEAINQHDSLLKIARAAMEMDRLLCFSDKIYDVREREGQGWEGPNVQAYSNALMEFKAEVKNLPPAEDKEKE